MQQPEHRFGHFAPDGKSFVVTDPATPRAFDNFLWNDSVMACVHQTGVGTCDVQIDGAEAIQVFTGVGRVCDIEAYGRDHLMSRLIYVRDNETGEFWNVGWEPVCRDYDAYACEHGLGYTRITSSTSGIRGSLLVLVPPGNAPVEQWKLSIENLSDRARSLSIFVYNQYTLSYMWGFESYGDMLYRGSWYDEACDALLVQKHPYVAPHDYLTAFLTADRKPDGYDGSRRLFVGDYATLAAPQAVVRGACTNTPGSSEATIAALQFNVDLAIGATDSIEFVHGLSCGAGQVAELKREHLGTTDAQFARLREQKATMVARNRIETPDPHFNHIVNVWLKQQCLFGATWCRWGYMGYRDIVQHGFGVSSFAPERTREILLEALAHMKRGGVALRGWNPVDTKPYSDSTLWLVYTLCAYIRETGDTDLLACVVPYHDEGEGTVLEHIESALHFLEMNKGSHGLCLIKFGDWNDSLTNIGKQGRGESAWLSMAYVHALEEMAGLYAHLDATGRAAGASRRADAMRTAVKRSAWDGDWYVRCFDDRGQPVGSHTNDQGQIFLNAQSWAVIAGVADEARQERMLRSARERLLTPVGYRLVAPPYLERDDHIGRISYLEPGICENGTVYSHGNAFMFLAQLLAGFPDDAYDTFQRMTPGYMMSNDCPKQLSPPYVYANGHYAPEHRNSPLQAEFTWITGSVAWWINTVLDFMIGVRRDYDGIVFDPKLPAEWNDVTIERSLRGRLFNVAIRRTGQFSVSLNGKLVDGNKVYYSACTERNTVEVTI